MSYMEFNKSYCVKTIPTTQTRGGGLFDNLLELAALLFGVCVFALGLIGMCAPLILLWAVS